MIDKPKRKNDEPIPRRYWWIFGILAIVLLYYPIRILSDWRLNPILYVSLTLMCLIVTVHFIRAYHEKWGIFALVLLCTLLSASHISVSVSEIDNCYIDDDRYSKYIACHLNGEWRTHTGYQQIASLPIGMTHYCWYEADKPLNCLAYRLQLWSPILVIACVIHYFAGRRRRNAEILTVDT